ncbi:hypothetical protein VPNG_04690 [Cytospora leucostoma]|uniref:Major facilitator superfamily (MFS) profile domain-containing protein n=1 Tax=Cytospora leucostoma TaxID=1230097 RepID=A0A423XAK0_9PEZI|nr:hypothetical protein VPNG_04690 [Cytospora leucostoma]
MTSRERWEDDLDRQISDVEEDANTGYNRRASDEVERPISHCSISTSNGSTRVHAQEGADIDRIPTQHEHNRELQPSDLDRIQTARSQHSATVGGSSGLGRSNTATRDSKRPMPTMGAGKPLPPPVNMNDFLVEFDGPDDPLLAMNWPLRKKVVMSAIVGFTTLTSAFTSSMFSTDTRAVGSEFHVSTEVAELGVSFYVLGFAFGPTIWAPVSELKGRRLPIVLSMFGFSIFTIACAAGKDLQTILICRFFAGFCGACPLAVVAAVFSDMFNNATRGIAITIFSLAVFTGPLMAPFIGGFIVDSYLGWRWTMYIPSFMGFLAFALDLLFLQETYPPQVLVSKAAELRRRTKNHLIHARQEEIEIDFKDLIQNNLMRPMRLLFQEPIVLLLSIYMSFIYGILYLFLTAYPLVFQGVHGWKSGLSGLTFFGMILGEVIAGIVVLAQQPWYMRKLKANNGVSVPEWRLPSIIAGGVAFMGGLFWFGWSGYRADIHWIVPTLSGLLTGFGLMSIFLQSLNYLVDAYLIFAASAIAGNTFMRSLCGATFPLFATYMFNGMGIQWASTLLGCVAAVLVPIPVIFWLYGAKIRSKSKLAASSPTKPGPEPDDEVAVEKVVDGDAAVRAAAPKKAGDEASLGA